MAGDARALKGDAALAAGHWEGAARNPRARPASPVPASSSMRCLAPASTGRSRVWGAPMIEAINAADAKIYAVDLPSGINGTSGKAQGRRRRCQRDHHLLSPQAWPSACCRAVSIAARCGLPNIGIGADVLHHVKPQTFLNVPRAVGGKPSRSRVSTDTKYGRGHAVVVSGGIASTGAARLAARGALRAGAGLVTLASPRSALAVNAAASLAVMVHPIDGEAELAAFMGRSPPQRRGAGTRRRSRARDAGKWWRAALTAACAVVLDADALTSFAEQAPGTAGGHPGRIPMGPRC